MALCANLERLKYARFACMRNREYRGVWNFSDAAIYKASSECACRVLTLAIQKQQQLTNGLPLNLLTYHHNK